MRIKSPLVYHNQHLLVNVNLSSSCPLIIIYCIDHIYHLVLTSGWWFWWWNFMYKLWAGLRLCRVAYIIRCCWLITGLWISRFVICLGVVASVSSVSYWWNWGSNQSPTSDDISHHNLSPAQSLYIKFHHQNHLPEVRMRWHMWSMQCIIMRGQDKDELTF